MSKSNKIYDLEERTAKFGENIIKFCKSLPKNVITFPRINQIIRLGTSIGSNYCEADCTETKEDFEHKVGISKKESRGTKHWLRMIAKAVPDKAMKSRILWKEANELNLILITIVKNSRKKD